MSLRMFQYLSYREYLETDQWRETRAEAIARAGGRCALCPREDPDGSEKLVFHVHHRSYQRIGEELPGDLVVLCEACHEALEVGKQVCAGAR